jgi:ribonuclease P protein component
MLLAAQRFSLREHPDFFSTARKQFLAWGSVYVLRSSEKLSSPLLASVIVRKSRFRTSVQRHTVKRQFSALIGSLFQAHLKKNDALPHSTLQLVVIPTQPLTADKKQAIIQDLTLLISQ